MKNPTHTQKTWKKVFSHWEKMAAYGEKELKILRESRRNHDLDIPSARQCEFCQVYLLSNNKYSCEGCPIATAGFAECRDTPFTDVSEIYDSIIYPNYDDLDNFVEVDDKLVDEWRQKCQSMVEFLKEVHAADKIV